MSKVEFAFLPGDYVVVTHFGLDLPARVLRCVLQRGGVITYDVEVCTDCETSQRTFFEDELSDGATDGFVYAPKQPRY